MNTTNPMDFLNAMKPEQWAANATGYARTMLTEMEKQAARWAEYGATQAAEAQRLVTSLQAQAFGVGKSILDTADNAFKKPGV